jgi:uncharacterized protein (TIGR03437 family)
MLRLSVSALVWYSGSPTTQTVCASNAGDGSLALSAWVQSGVTWLTVSVDAAQCIQFTIDVSSLPRGTYTASVTVSDPNAIDAPQVVTATALVGGGDPVAVDQFLAPGMTNDIPFYTGDASTYCTVTCPAATTSTQDGGTWLSVVFTPFGTLGTFAQTGYIHLAPPASMAPGTYSGGVTLKNYTARTIPITMRVTTQPIAVPSTSQIQLRLAQGGPAAVYPFLPPISFTNSGMGALEVQGVAATGEGVSAYQYGDLAMVTVDPLSRGPGLYNDGTVTIQCNGANCPVQVPVSLEIVPQAAPTVAYLGVVNNANFSGVPVAPGEVCIVKGEQLSLSSPATAAGFPLPTRLGGATVLVNDVLAPLYYTSFGQIAFQMPYGTATGTTLVQVERDGQISNTVSVDVTALAPQILVVTDTSYQLRDSSHPSKPGETLIVWAIGLGATNPPVDAGTAAPANPPAVIASPGTVAFVSGGYQEVTPSFAGLSPGSAGLYQFNVTVPMDMPAGTIWVWLHFQNWFADSAPLRVQSAAPIPQL